MTSLITELSLALFMTILHSIWQGGALALAFAAFRRQCRTSQSEYLLALMLFGIAPIAFLVTFFQSYSDASSVVQPVILNGASAPPIAFYCAIAWLTGVLFVGGRFLCAWIWLRVVILQTADTVAPSVQALFNASKRQLKIADRVVVRSSLLIRSPMVTGIIKPVVLLPLSMINGVPPNVLSAAFLHELLHVKRLDHMAIMIQALGETLLFYHPALRWLSKEVRRAREYRCDDDTIAALGDKYEYARALVALEQSRNDDAVPALMMNGGDLMDRVERILVTRRSVSGANLNFVFLATILCVVLFSYSVGAYGGTDSESADDSPHALTISWLPQSVTQWRSEIEQAAERHNISADFLALVLFRESGGDERATSPIGARGLMQVMPRTAEQIAQQRGISDFSIERLFDPAINIDFGAWYLASQMAKFSDHKEPPFALAASAYNAGPGAVRSYLAGTQPLPEETINYRDMLMALLSERDADRSQTIDNYMKKLRQGLPAFQAPVQGRVSASFGPDDKMNRMHEGIDIVAPEGAPVIAPAGGRVVSVGEGAKRGKYVVVRHAAGIESHYFHLSDIAVTSGTQVAAGEALGGVGNTGVSSGPHLHFEIREFGDPVSPALYGLGH